MKKALKIAKEFLDECIQSVESNSHIDIFCKSIGTSNIESFSLTRRFNEVSIEASNGLCAAYAMSYLKKNILNTCNESCFGEKKPIFPLRPIWIRCDTSVAITENIGIHIPTLFLDVKKKKIESFCRRTIELGFNAVILGSYGECFGEKPNVVFNELATLCQLFADFGLKLILKPFIYVDTSNFICSPLSLELSERVSSAIKQLLQEIPDIEYLFWTSLYENSDFQFHPLGRNKTKEEKTLIEMKILEKSLQSSTKLIYYLPCKNKKIAEEQSKWLLNLMKEAKSPTIIAFSSVAGPPSQDHLEIHPFFDRIQNCLRTSFTPLLPILNVGGIDQGEGLWPNICFELNQKYFSYLNASVYIGIIHLTATMPRQGSFLDCALWTSAQLMWEKSPVEVLVKTWFKAFHKNLESERYIFIFKKTRQIIVELSEKRILMELENTRDQLNQDLLRFQGLRLLAECKEIECLLKIEQAEKGNHITIKDYYRFFLRDVRNLIKKVLLQFDVSAPNNLEGEDKGDGFWVNADLKISSQLLENPNIGDVGSPSHKIYWESNLEVD